MSQKEATESKSTDTSRFEFTDIKRLPVTPVKNQAHSSTCWSFATISFLESELLRMKSQPVNLSEMFVVRKIYPIKAERYVRLHGKMSYGAGSLAGDVIRVIREFGIVPEAIYRGDFAGESFEHHVEMDAMLTAALDAVIGTKGGKISKVWPQAIAGILDAYLGEVPKTFRYNGESYSPETLRDSLGLNLNNYIDLTSYTHHPFFKSFCLEVPDNWSLNEYVNMPLEAFMAVIDHAIEKGFTLVWDGDITERSFNQNKGVAILPQKSWTERTRDEKNNLCEVPEPEIMVNQSIRQELFDNYTSTDDHLMHLIGTARDQTGTKFYLAKNSWGSKGSKYDGFIYLSESYVRAKTISVMVHKDALTQQLAQKLERH